MTAVAERVDPACPDRACPSSQTAARRSEMHPFWLTFRAPVLERLWRADQRPRLRSVDESFFLVFGLLVSITAIRAWRVKTRIFDRVLLAVVVSEFFVMRQFIRWRPESYSKYRDAIVALQKTMHFLAICHLVLVEQEPYETWAHFFLYDILHYGKTVFMAINGLLLPLSFREHLFVQSLQLIISSLYNPKMCRAFLQRIPSNASKYRQVVEAFDSVFNPAAVLPASKPRDSLAFRANQERPCLQAHCFLQMMWGFVLPGIILFAAEAHSRSAFWARRLGRERKTSQHCLRCCLPSLCLLYLGLFGLWHWFGWLLSRR